jgi:hypothetical protein
VEFAVDAFHIEMEFRRARGPSTPQPVSCTSPTREAFALIDAAGTCALVKVIDVLVAEVEAGA